MSALILTFVSDCTQQHHKSSYVSSPFPLFLPRLQSTHFSPWPVPPVVPCGPPGHCIAAFAVSEGREGREPSVTSIGAGNQFREFALRQTHLQARLRDRLSAESEVGGNSCIRDILHCAADKVSGSELFLEKLFMQIKTNKHHSVLWTKVAYHVVSVHQIRCYLVHSAPLPQACCVISPATL